MLRRCALAFLFGVGALVPLGCSLFLDTSGLDSPATGDAALGSEASIFTSPSGVLPGDDGGPVPTDAASDADAAPPRRGCAPTHGTRQLCEEFTTTALPPGWTTGVTSGASLTVSPTSSVSTPYALLSQTPLGDDSYARIFRKYPGSFTHAYVDFDVRVDTGEPFVLGVDLGSCSYLLGIKADDRSFLYTNSHGEDLAQVADVTGLFPQATWRHATLDVTGSTARLLVEGTERVTMTANVLCDASGPIQLSLGDFFKGGATVYLDNVSLDTEQ